MFAGGKGRREPREIYERKVKRCSGKREMIDQNEYVVEIMELHMHIIQQDGMNMGS